MQRFNRSRPSPTPFQHSISRQLHENRTVGERIADGIANQIGSWRFVILQSIAVLLWIVLNIVAIISHWDPYPFVLLNMLFSVQEEPTSTVMWTGPWLD